jgi:hypothetical protein
MGQPTIDGPIRTINGPGGVSSPLFIVPFDKRGVCTGPSTAKAAVDAARAATDVYVFAHGWNTKFRSATRTYDRFIGQLLSLREQFWPVPDRDYRPVLVGVFWPSIALLAESEQAPDIAADPGEADPLDGAADGTDLAEQVRALGEGLPPEAAVRLYELLDSSGLAEAEALEVARLVLQVVDAEDDDLAAGSAAGGAARGPAGAEAEAADPAQDLLDVWIAADQLLPAAGAGPGAAATAHGGFVDDGTGPDAAGPDVAGTEGAPQVAGLLDVLDPRNVIRMATVLQMKDRAGRVGATGVADLLTRMTAGPNPPRVHLVGHSYGCKVMLSALCAPPDPGPRVDSVLLLQAAVSGYCFAPAGGIPGTDRPGGYHQAPARSRLPVMCTFTRHDLPLTLVFHLAVRRKSDLGEIEIAGAPSRFAALGGFGPQGLPTAMITDPVLPPVGYQIPAGPGVLAIRADDVIGGHGNVTSEATAWMLLSQVRS